MITQKQKYQEFKKRLTKELSANAKVSNRKVDFTQFSNFLNAENSIEFKEGAENNYAVHQRVSTFKQVDEGESLEMQEKLAEKVLKEKKGKRFKTYLEEGVSASKKKLSERNEMLELLNDFQDGNFKNIISYNQDRLFRNEKEAPSILLYLITNGVTIYYTRGGKVEEVNREKLGDYGLMEIMFNAKKASQESQATSERVADVRHELFLQGKIVQSYIPHGYIKNNEGKVVQVEEEIAIIKEIEDLYLSGVGIHTILKWLNGEESRRLGKRNSKAFRRKIRENDPDYWTKNTIEGLLFGKFFHGIISNKYRGREAVEVQSKEHEPFRTVERYNEIVNFKNNKKDKKLPPRHYDSEYLLKGVLHCGECNEPYQGRTVTKKGNELYRTYYCRSLHKTSVANDCENKNYNAEMLETFVLLKMKNYLSKFDLSKLAIDLAENVNQDDKKLDFELDNLAKQISSKESERNGLKGLMRRKSDQIDKEKDEEVREDFEEELEELENDSRKLRKEIKELKEKYSQLEEETENENMFNYELGDIFDKMKLFVDHFEDTVDYRKKLLLEEIVEKIIIDKEGNAEIQYALPLDELVETANQLAVAMENNSFGGVGELTPPKNILDLNNKKPIYIKELDHIDDSNYYRWIEEIYIEARSKFKEFLIGTTLKYTENGRINAWQLANKTGISHSTAKSYFNYTTFPTEEIMIRVLKPFNKTPKDFVKFLKLDNYIDSKILFEIIVCVNRWCRDDKVKISETEIGKEIERRVEKYKEKDTINRQVIYSERNVMVEEWRLADNG